MIVDPDFPDHWKTRMFVDLLDGDEAGVACILRLWAHCQNRRTHIFSNISSQALKAICRFPGHANKLESSLLASGFVRRDGENLTVHEWDRYNASLVANWENGKKGGRPTTPTLKENPKETHGLPRVNPSVTDREEKRREELNPAHSPREALRVMPTLDQAKAFAPTAGVSEEAAEHWWLGCDSRPLAPDGAFTDRDGIAIHRWQSSLTSFGRKWQANDHQRQRVGGKHAGASRAIAPQHLDTNGKL